LVGFHVFFDFVFHFGHQAFHHLLHFRRVTVQLTTTVFNPVDQSIQYIELPTPVVSS
jgi:hypothetical protein